MMTVERDYIRSDGKRCAVWKCSKCGDKWWKKLSWRQIKYRDNKEYRNYTKNKMREIYYKRKHEKIASILTRTSSTFSSS